MILPKSEDALHKAQLFRVLSVILDDIYLSSNLYFKGGTCAAMLGFLDRFSIDLDFDLKKGIDKERVHKKLSSVFKRVHMQIKEKSKNTLFYLLKYDSSTMTRNTLKLSIFDSIVKSNVYTQIYLPEIDRYGICQTPETMFANKLVAVIDRYNKHESIAGRDIYDIHHFFIRGMKYNHNVIEERTGKKTIFYLKELADFIENKVTDRIITQDLNFLLPQEKFQLVRKVLKKETVMFLNDEIRRI